MGEKLSVSHCNFKSWVKMSETDSNKYLLGRKNFQSHLAEISKELFTDGYFTDVTLVTDDMCPIKVHRTVLIAASPVFKQLLTLFANQRDPLLFLKGVCQEDLKSLIEFIYLGETEICEERLEQFLKVANDFNIKDLVKTGSHKKDQLEVSSTIIEKDVDVELYKQVHDSKKSLGVTPLPQNLKTMKNNTEVKLESLETEYERKTTSELTTENSSVFQCNKCNIQYTAAGNLRQHIRSKHEGIKYPCNYCDHKATRSTTLRMHMRAHHSKN